MSETRMSRLPSKPVYWPLLDEQIEARAEAPKQTRQEEAGEKTSRQGTDPQADRRVLYDLD